MKIFKCNICGKIVEVVNDSAGKMVCCGQPMEELIPGTSDGAVEKHVPVVTVSGTKVEVMVGEVEHPMMDAHYIQWIAIETAAGTQRKNLKPADAPKAVFELADGDTLVKAYAYCNLHGLWSSK